MFRVAKGFPLAVLLAGGLGVGSLQAALNVVATTADLGAIAAVIGGNSVKVKVLAKPSEDPHFVDPRPSMIVSVNRADVLIESGAELEGGWLPSLTASARNRKIQLGQPGRIEAMKVVELLEVPDRLDRSEGDVHGKGNPHFLMDPMNAIRVAKLIADRLCLLEPQSQSAIRENQETFQARLETKMEDWKKRLSPYAGRSIVAYHNTWPYFAQRFGLNIDLFLEPKPGIPPSPGHLSEVIQTMKSKSAKVILLEPYQNRRTAEKVASETGAFIVEGAQQPGAFGGTADDYIALMDLLVERLASGLAQP